VCVAVVSVLQCSGTQKYVNIRNIERVYADCVCVCAAECKMVISEGSDVVLTASSHKPLRRSKSCQPKDATLNSHRAWCARRKDEHQWLQWDLGPPHLVTGVVTRSRRDTGRNHWVKAYTLTYSNDSKVWFTYKDDNHLDTKMSQIELPVFGGNLDKHTERRHYLNSPFKARYVRPHPQRWRRSIALCAALIGCPHKGDCGEGFFRVPPDTSCGECVWLYQDQQILYRDYVFGLDRLTVFVENQRRLDTLSPQDHKKCASITRLNNALFRERVHVECPQPIKGRFPYIKASGVANRWHRVFSMVLCEVMAY
ncbi:EGF-like repeat and discoidin I-like domain-containing protein 3, partial [Eriocheir sinensis]|uniref:EGF-like repeat and discoidin I-like domain-containing protein 3 n=1 Tax=Eriocheir sinensis TaxID=95602 RepID=UPI0021C9BA95